MQLANQEASLLIPKEHQTRNAQHILHSFFVCKNCMQTVCKHTELCCQLLHEWTKLLLKKKMQAIKLLKCARFFYSLLYWLSLFNFFFVKYLSLNVDLCIHFFRMYFWKYFFYFLREIGVFYLVKSCLCGVFWKRVVLSLYVNCFITCLMNN